MSVTDARNAMASLIETKRDACRRKPMTDLSQMVQVHWSHGGTTIVGLGMFDRDATPRAVTTALTNHPPTQPGCRIDWIAHCSDARRKFVEHESPAVHAALARHGRGTADRALAAGDMSVEDVLTVVVANVDGSLVCASQPYRYDDGGQPKFGTIEIIVADTSVDSGEVPRLLLQAIADAKEDGRA